MRPSLIALLFGVVACGAPSVARPVGVVPTVVTAAAEGDLRIGELGRCVLDSGEVIEECRLGYRTFGKLDATRSNAVLWPTWFTGTTRNLDFVPRDYVDTKRFFLVLVDAIGNGISSSPSSSRTQARLHFPKFTIHDMVESQRRLMREVLHVEKLHTVMGISMGGMQSFEWAVSHPDEVARIVPIVGTPQLTAQDLLLWHAELDILDGSKAYAGGDYADRPKLPALQEMHWLMLSTPAQRNEETSRSAFDAFLKEKGNDAAFDWNDWHRQLEAMIAHDIARADAGDLARAAKRVKSRALIIVAEHDHMVNPAPSKAFAKALGAKLLISDSPWGHMAPGQDAAVPAAVKAFLAE